MFGFRDYWLSAAFGLFAVGVYFVLGMIGFYYFVLKVKGKDFLERWGMVRFTIVGLLLVLMMSLPVKMILRLAFNVKYVLVTPWINI
jgi:hypothetical protein